jgi:RimJ/RimL family protein N-acetyltransferase
VAAADHRTWLRRVLADPDRRLLVAEHAGTPVGTVRFDRDGDAWEVSITVAPAARGRGLAVPVLLAAERDLGRVTEAATDGADGGVTVRASVHRDNAASTALFRRAGYRPAGADDPFAWLVKSAV